MMANLCKYVWANSPLLYYIIMCKFSTLKGHFFDSSMSFGEPSKVLFGTFKGSWENLRRFLKHLCKVLFLTKEKHHSMQSVYRFSFTSVTIFPSNIHIIREAYEASCCECVTIIMLEKIILMLLFLSKMLHFLSPIGR